jgi:hypothetical protein
LARWHGTARPADRQPIFQDWHKAAVSQGLADAGNRRLPAGDRSILTVHSVSLSGLESGSASQAASDPRGSIPEEAMQLQPFDLNDISHEPSDEQLDDLMEAVAAEARRHGQAARAQLMVRLRAEITAIKPPCRREA